MTGTTSVVQSPRVFRGWWVLAGVFLMMTIGSGFAFYAQGVFLEALVAEQGFSVGMAGAGTGLFFLVSGIAGYYAGGLISRFDIRAVIVAGATVASIGIVLLGLVRTEWQMFVVFIIYGGGYAFTGLVPGTSLVTRWFHVRRSVALSIASTGLSVGGIAITPIIATLIDARSLVDLAPQLAVAYWLGIVIPTLLLLRPSPESMGLRPDGAASLPVGSAPEIVPGVDFAVAVRTRFFRFLSAGFVLVMGAQVGAIQHLFKLVKDGFDVEVANLVLIVVTSMSVFARLAGGVAATRVPIRLLATTLVLVQAVGIATIGLAEEKWMIFLGVIILGAAMGNLLMLHPLILADAFGVRDYPRIYGLGSLLMVTGVGLGPFVVGVIRDLSSYRAAYLTMSVIALVGFVIVRMAGAPDRTWVGAPIADLPPTDSVTASASTAAFAEAAAETEAQPLDGVGGTSPAVFAAVTQDLEPRVVRTDGRRNGRHDVVRDDRDDTPAWNPDPAWPAPDPELDRLTTASLETASGNGSNGNHEVRFRRPPTILPIPDQSDPEHQTSGPSVVRRTPPPMPGVPAQQPGFDTGRPPSVSRPPSVVTFEMPLEDERFEEPLIEVEPQPVQGIGPGPASAVEPMVQPRPDPVPRPEPPPARAEPEPIRQPIARTEPVSQPQLAADPQISGGDSTGAGVSGEAPFGGEESAEASRFAVPMAIASTTVAVALMAWVRWISRSDGSGPGDSS